LCQRVIVLSERPARIRSEIDVDLPYPRLRDDPRIVSLRRQILNTMGFGG
jgi:NitT/TauT family transport system ATP-binding protein